MNQKLLNLFFITAVVIGSGFSCGTSNQTIEDVSLMQLIVDPDIYHNKLVRVIGVTNIEFEGDSVWFTKEHFQHNIYRNALWIEPDYEFLESSRQQLEQLNGKYVLLEGTFNKDNHGHLGMYSGAVEKITRFRLWEKDGADSHPSDISSPTPSATNEALSVQLNQPFTMREDELARLSKMDLNLEFLEVLEDSRCPANVECAEAGQARILINAHQMDQAPATLELNTNPPLKQDVVTYEKFQIQLLALNPYPEDIDQTIPETAYQAILVVTDLP